ncbi:hypothetical protein P7C73_g3038, partial [Tremellales sp. Uapishka_1]
MISSFLLLLTCVFSAAAAPFFEESSSFNYNPQVVTVYKGINVTYSGYLNTTSGLEMFTGVPYAMPPVGALRFKAPAAFKPQQEVMVNVTLVTPVCKQPDVNTSVEDCLTVNIARHTGVQSHERLPVLVWFYGGDFVMGSAGNPQYDPAGIVQTSIDMGNPVIMVVVNYRIHAYGFMMGEAAEKANATNAGLLDQRLALEWIHEHIHAFGGDPKKVTIFGASAGGTSIVAQMILEGMDEKGLFRAAMHMSGAFAQNFDRQATIGAADVLYNLTGCTAANTTDQIACLQALSEEDLFKSVVATLADYPGDSFGPYNDTKVFPDHPTALIKQGYLAKVPLISGDVIDEAGSYAPKDVSTNDIALVTAGEYFTFATGINGSTIWPYYASPNLTDLSPHYVNATALAGFSEYFERFCTMAGDAWFNSAREFLMKVQMERNLPLWVYKFAEEYPVDSPLGVVHYMDIPFWFSHPAATPSAVQKTLATSMTRALVSYAVTMDPSAISGVNWESYYSDASYLQWKADDISMKPNNAHREGLDYIISLFP